MTSHNILTSPAPPEAVLEHIKPGADVIMPNANGEAVKLVDTLEEHDDVNEVHANFDVPDEVMEALDAE